MFSRNREPWVSTETWREAGAKILGIMALSGFLCAAGSTAAMIYEQSKDDQPPAALSMAESEWLGFGLTDLSLPLAIGGVYVVRRASKWILQPSHQLPQDDSGRGLDAGERQILQNIESHYNDQ